jgi:hypothetical protein
MAMFLKLKLHLFDLLWICGTTCCTAKNPQLFDKSTTNPQLYDKSTANPQLCDKPYSLLYNKSTANRQQIEQVEFEL